MKKCIITKLSTLFLLLFATNAYSLPKGFVDVQTIIPDITVDLRYLGASNFLGRKS